MVEDCPGIDIEVLTDLPYRGGITSLPDKCSDEFKDLSLPGSQFHKPPPGPELSGFQSYGKGKDASFVDACLR